MPDPTLVRLEAQSMRLYLRAQASMASRECDDAICGHWKTRKSRNGAEMAHRTG